jgi:predicted regulator of Ras-like GTPase activity (Roadblock/LC7/MglB family)
MAVEGRLNELSLTTLIQMACQEGGTARLTLDRDGEQATLYFDAGTIVHAATGERNGEEAVYHILTWQDGTFSLEPGVGPPGRSVHTHWSALLMDGLQQVDETRWDDGTHLVEEPFTLPENVQDILRELSTQVEGFVVASLVGMDSIPIAQHESAGVDVEAINAQMTLLVKLVDTSVNRLAAGTLEDYLLTTERAYLLLRLLEDGQHYLGLVADRRRSNLGHLRLNSRVYTRRIEQALG